MINFKYNSDENYATVETDQHICLNIHFNSNGDVDFMSDGGGDYYPSYDTNDGIFFCIKGKYISVKELFEIAEERFPVLFQESFEDDMREMDYRVSTGSLEYAGRV